MGILKEIFGGSRRQEFWQWFAENSQELRAVQTCREPICNELFIRLHKINKFLTFLFGPVVEGNREFIIGADGLASEFPCVMKLVSEAPDLPDWKIIAFRPAVPDGPISIELNGFKLDPEDVFFSAALNKGLVDVAVYVRDADSVDNKTLGGAVFLMLDHTLGEYEVGTKIGAVTWQQLPDDPGSLDLKPITHLSEVFKRLTT